MRYLLISSVNLFLSSPVPAEDTALAQAANTVRPAVEAATSYTHKSILQTPAGGKGPLPMAPSECWPALINSDASTIEDRGARCANASSRTA